MKKLLALLSILLLLTSCSRIVLLSETDPEADKDYLRACDLLKSGDYEQAYALFVKLGDYKDSKTHADKFVWLVSQTEKDGYYFGDKMAVFKTVYTYNEYGELVTCVGSYTNDEGPGYSESHVYDSDGKRISSETVSEAGESKITYEYNKKGQLVKKVGYTNGPDLGSVTSFTYDSKGNCTVAEHKSFMGTDTSTYETDQPYHVDRNDYTYDENGRCIKTTTKLGDMPCTHEIKYDGLGLPITVTTSASDGTFNQTTLTYDSQGRCTKVVTPYGTTEFCYTDKNLPDSAVKTENSDTPINIKYTYKLHYLKQVAAKIPFHIQEYFSEFDI